MTPSSTANSSEYQRLYATPWLLVVWQTLAYSRHTHEQIWVRLGYRAHTDAVFSASRPPSQERRLTAGHTQWYPTNLYYLPSLPLYS